MAGYQKGHLKFELDGEKLKGSWVLVHTRGFGGSQNSWLLIKHRDEFASAEDILTEKPRSVLTRRLLADIAKAEGGDATKAATGDPAPAASPTASSASSAAPSRKRSASANESAARNRKPAASAQKRATNSRHAKTKS